MVNLLVGVPVPQFFISSPSSPDWLQLALHDSGFVKPQGKKTKVTAKSHNKRAVFESPRADSSFEPELHALHHGHEVSGSRFYL